MAERGQLVRNILLFKEKVYRLCSAPWETNSFLYAFCFNRVDAYLLVRFKMPQTIAQVI